MRWRKDRRYPAPTHAAGIIERFYAGQYIFGTTGVYRGEVRRLQPIDEETTFLAFLAITAFVIVAYLVLTWSVFFLTGLWDDELLKAFLGYGSLAILVFMWCNPWFVLTYRWVRYRRSSVWHGWWNYRFDRRGLAIVCIGVIPTWIISYHWPQLWDHFPIPDNLSIEVIFSIAVSLLAYGGLRFAQAQDLKRGTHGRSLLDLPPAPKKSSLTGWFVYLGQSTGRLAHLGHHASLAPLQPTGLGIGDACQNLLILGAIGSGKTTTLIHPILLQLMHHGWGGLIFDIKGDFLTAVRACAKATQRQINIIGTGTSYNLLANLTPEMSASILKSAFLLGNAHVDRFWLDTAAELCRNALGILIIFPKQYTLAGLYDYLFDEESREQTRAAAEQIKYELPPAKQTELDMYLRYEERIFKKFDDKIRSGVMATCAQILSPFSHPTLQAAFCSPNADALSWSHVMERELFLVELPLATWGLGGKVVYTFLKLSFFNVMQQRAQHPEWNQDNYVMFMCDEYQDIISASPDGLSDLNFWDKSRSSKTVGIISAQSVTSFNAVLGSREATFAILQNFRHKLCFRTEDEMTQQWFQSLLGQTDIVQESYSQNENTPNKLGEFGSTTTGMQRSLHRRSVIDGQFFRQLAPNECLALLNLGNWACDDVLVTQPLFVKNEELIWPQKK